jgi:hypothetical protein
MGWDTYDAFVKKLAPTASYPLADTRVSTSFDQDLGSASRSVCPSRPPRFLKPAQVALPSPRLDHERGDKASVRYPWGPCSHYRVSCG